MLNERGLKEWRAGRRKCSKGGERRNGERAEGNAGREGTDGMASGPKGNASREEGGEMASRPKEKLRRNDDGGDRP